MLNQPMSSPMITMMFGRCCCAAAGRIVTMTAASSASATRHNFRMIFMVLPSVEELAEADIHRLMRRGGLCNSGNRVLGG